MSKPWTPERKAASAERMKRLNERMRTDPALKTKCVKGQKRARRKPGYRAMQALTMAETMARPEVREKARQHACKINRDPEVRKRQWAGRVRSGKVPTPPRARPQPKLTGDALFLQLLALEAKQAGAKPA
jgi:hypothetical protein